MRDIAEYIAVSLNENSYINFTEEDIDKMSEDELYDALESAAAAKAACFARKDKKGEKYAAEILNIIRTKLKR